MVDHKYALETYGGDNVTTFLTDTVTQMSLSAKPFRSWFTKSAFKKTFLPKGYPDSVSPDYLEYQIWDTVQALASSVTGALAAQSVLIGVGVGDVKATILGASLSWMLKDGSGMIGKILFVGWQGSSLDCDCKRWRLLADIINDCALFLELISPFMPSIFTFTVCLANICKSIVSVAGGATRAAITLHQARDNNVADVAAKDGSQETLSNLLALLLNLCLVYYVTGNWGIIWTGFVILTGVHLYANYRAVQCLQLSTFNRNRFSIAVQWWLRRQLSIDHVHASFNPKQGHFPSVEWVNAQEPILLTACTAEVHLGCSLRDLPIDGQADLQNLIGAFSQEKYLLYSSDWRSLTQGTNSSPLTIYIVLVQGCQPLDQLTAMLHAELLVLLSRIAQESSLNEVLRIRKSNTVTDFFQLTLEWTKRLLTKMVCDISASAAPHWNLESLHFCADEWRCTWINQ